MSHKILETIGDEPIETIELLDINHPTSLTNEALSMISTRNKSKSEFKHLSLDFITLDEEVSPTVLD